MFEILVVCTGNICRSPLAEVVLRGTLERLGGRVHSAGTQDAAPMTPVQRYDSPWAPTPRAASAHRSAYLGDHLASPDLILASAGSTEDESPGATLVLHRSRVRRLATGIPDADIVSAVASAGPDAAARGRR